MQITSSALRALSQGFQAAFLKGIESVAPKWPLVAMEVASTHKMENYGWMKDIPGMREWTGDRVINNLEAISYQIVNKHFEQTIGVDRDDIEDDVLGIYANRFAMQGEIAAQHADTLVWKTLLTAFTTAGLDGQNFFGSTHPGYDANGADVSYSNYQTGALSPWFLMDLSRTYMKPLVFQKRQEVRFVQKTRDDNDDVFNSRTFKYGVDGRYNVGFGFHQLAYAGKVALTGANYQAARLAMLKQCKPDGSSVNVTPTHLLVGPTLEADARALLKTEYTAGSTNYWFNSAELVVVPALG